MISEFKFGKLKYTKYLGKILINQDQSHKNEGYSEVKIIFFLSADISTTIHYCFTSYIE